MIHIIGWQLGDSTHLKVIYTKLFIWLRKSSVGGGNSLSPLWLWVALSILGLENPGSPWQPLDLRALEWSEEGRGGCLSCRNLLTCLIFWRIRLGSGCIRLNHCSEGTTGPYSHPSHLPFLLPPFPPSLFSPFFISFYKHLLSLY